MREYLIFVIKIKNLIQIINKFQQIMILIYDNNINILSTNKYKNINIIIQILFKNGSSKLNLFFKTSKIEQELILLLLTIFSPSFKFLSSLFSLIL